MNSPFSQRLQSNVSWLNGAGHLPLPVNVLIQFVVYRQAFLFGGHYRKLKDLPELNSYYLIILFWKVHFSK